ncbi:MAG TPA: cupin domain-containing protein [Burkholderiales bacterium]|nr:cupin domain-containing protein [Burkholderiales bacterium]
MPALGMPLSHGRLEAFMLRFGPTKTKGIPAFQGENEFSMRKDLMQSKPKMLALLGGALVLSLSMTTIAFSQEGRSGMRVIVPTDKQWEKNKAMPYGMKVLALYGDPAQPGPYAYRVRVPTGYKWPPMKFSDDRVTTILKGTLWMAEGERYDPMKMKELEAGSMFVTHANTAHYQWARTEVVLQIMGTGPISNPVTYINPDDDPRGE